MKLNPICLMMLFITAKINADTTIEAFNSEIKTVSFYLSKSLPDSAGSRKYDGFIARLVLDGLPTTCELGDLSARVSFKSSGSWLEPTQEEKIVFRHHEYSRKEWIADSAVYLDDRPIYGINYSGTIKCRGPMPSKTLTTSARIDHRRGDYNFIPNGTVNIPDMSQSVRINVSETIDFGTIYNNSPTPWAGLWRDDTPQHARISVDGNILGGPGAKAFSIDEDIGRLEFGVNGWIRLVPNGKPGTLSRSITVKIEYI